MASQPVELLSKIDDKQKLENSRQDIKEGFDLKKQKQANTLVDSKTSRDQAPKAFIAAPYITQFQVKQTPIVVKPKVDPKQLQTFLDHILHGRQDDAEKMLKLNKDLALASGNVTAHAERGFKNITGLQYAVWTLNWNMCTMILPHLTPEAAKEQTKGFIQGSWVKEHTEQANFISHNDNLDQQRSELVTDILRRALIFSTLEPVRGSVLDVPCMPYPVMSIVVEYDRRWRELQTFLNHIAGGRQDEAEAMLKANKDLALASGDITDHAKRNFKNITGFQYAVWALDWKMWTMLRQYLPLEAAREQTTSFTQGSWLKEYGECANWKNLTDALQVYIDKFDSLNNRQKHKYWVKQVNGITSELPIHALQEYNNARWVRCFDFVPQWRRSWGIFRRRTVMVPTMVFKATHPYFVLHSLMHLYYTRTCQRSELVAQMLGNNLGSMKNRVGSIFNSENFLSKPLIFSSNESPPSEGFFDNLIERKQSKETDEQAKLKLSQYLVTIEYELGKAVSKGDCFFDAVGQGLARRNITIPEEYQGEFAYKKLRQVCSKYATRYQHDQDHWLKMQFGKEKVQHQNYLLTVGFTAPEVHGMWNQKLLPSGIARRGRPDIDGRIICDVLKVKLHVLELMVVEGQMVLAHQLIDAHGSKSVFDEKEISEIYNDNRVVHLAWHQNALHWVPILAKLAKDKKRSYGCLAIALLHEYGIVQIFTK